MHSRRIDPMMYRVLQNGEKVKLTYNLDNSRGFKRFAAKEYRILENEEISSYAALDPGLPNEADESVDSDSVLNWET